MSVELLMSLREGGAFDHQPPYDRLADLHVPFDTLVQGVHVEGVLLGAVRAGERIALTGASGCGKSSVTSFVLSDPDVDLASIRVPVADVPTEHAAEPSGVLTLLLTSLLRSADDAGALDQGDRVEALTASSKERVRTTSRSQRGGVSVGPSC